MPTQLARGSQQLTGMLYSTQIDLDLDPLHHFPPGSWPCAPGTPQGQNAACAISPREQHGFRICKALYDDQGHHWRAHTKFQKSNRSSCRADLRYSSFCPPGPHPVGGVQMVRRPYLRTTVVDFSSETCLIVVSIVTDDDGTSFRTEIGNSRA